MEKIPYVHKDERLIIFKAEDILYPEYKGKFFVLKRSEGYGYFDGIIKLYTRGNILDEFGIAIK